MSRLKDLTREIHHRSLWQVILIYIGAAWVCYEIIATVADTMGLPAWLLGLAIVLFLLGLPFVIATALVHEVAPLAAASSEAEPEIVEARLARANPRYTDQVGPALSYLLRVALYWTSCLPPRLHLSWESQGRKEQARGQSSSCPLCV
jgi:hypothetical protein